jgi:hypothetical protein
MRATLAELFGGKMDNLISELDTLRGLIGFLLSIGPTYWVPIVAATFYGVAYSRALQKAAVNDARNYEQLETRHWMHTILWERAARFDMATIVYLLCVPVMPGLFLLGVLNAVNR